MSGPNSGHCTFLSESFTPNVWCPSTRKDCDFSTVFSNCAPWLHPARLAKSKGFLLPRVGGRFALFQTLRLALADFARRAGCADTSPISPHRLRHTWASEMLRCGISLPALMQLMGHKDIRMTLRYLKVTQPDLQREFYRARQNTAQPYPLPSLSVSAATADLPGIRQALAATRHLLEMYRRQLSDDKARRRLQRLDRRLLDVAQQLQNIAAGEK